MKVESTHHIDASEPDSEGMYEYYYEYDLYRFSEGDLVVVARGYIHEPEEAHFLRIEIAGKSRFLKEEDFCRPLVINAARHFQQIGKRKLNWLSGRRDGYEAVMLPVTD